MMPRTSSLVASSNIALLCWTIHLVGKFSRATNAQVDCRVHDDKTDEERKASAVTQEYGLFRHVLSLVGPKETMACLSVGGVLFVKTVCDLRMIRLSARFT